MVCIRPFLLPDAVSPLFIGLWRRYGTHLRLLDEAVVESVRGVVFAGAFVAKIW